MGQRRKAVSAALALAELRESVAVSGNTMRPLLRAGILWLLDMPEEKQLAVAGQAARLAREVPLMGPVTAFEVLLAVEQRRVQANGRDGAVCGSGNGGWGAGNGAGKEGAGGGERGV